MLQPCLEGKNVGLMSEAGCPGVADPGAVIVKLAYEKGIQVVPLVGPSSILLAIMASGMNGQSFAFNGYIPIDKSEKKAALKNLERLSQDKNQSRNFYRNAVQKQQNAGRHHSSPEPIDLYLRGHGHYPANRIHQNDAGFGMEKNQGRFAQSSHHIHHSQNVKPIEFILQRLSKIDLESLFHKRKTPITNDSSWFQKQYNMPILQALGQHPHPFAI